LAIDGWTHCLDFLMRAQDAGHTVLWYQKPRKDGQDILAGEGIVPRTSDFPALAKKWLDWADLIYVPDNKAYGDFLEPYFEKGYPIWGANLAARKLELDRQAGQESFRKAGLAVIEGKTFHDYDAAIAYVEKRGVPCVSKPSWDAGSELSYVAPDAASMVYMLDRWKHNPDLRREAKKHGFIIQDRIDGIEMGVAGWFGPGGWSQVIEENFEYKKLMDGDLGPNTGEQGTVLRFVKRSKLFEQVLAPCTELLKKTKYVGNASINCMIEPDGKPRPMEWTLRDGWPAKHNQVSLLKGDPAKWMLDLLNGYDTIQMQKAGLLSVSVVYTIPPYPYPRGQVKDVRRIPVYHAGDAERIHPVEMMMCECPVQVGKKVARLTNPATAGDYVLVATGKGETVAEARSDAYKAVRKITMPNSPAYRLDIGRGRMGKQLPALQKMGYATGIEL
jgi:phosphoribosylamine--glycine ligase